MILIPMVIKFGVRKMKNNMKDYKKNDKLIVILSVRVTEEQHKFLKDGKIDYSKWFRSELDKAIKDQ